MPEIHNITDVTQPKGITIRVLHRSLAPKKHFSADDETVARFGKKLDRLAGAGYIHIGPLPAFIAQKRHLALFPPESEVQGISADMTAIDEPTEDDEEVPGRLMVKDLLMANPDCEGILRAQLLGAAKLFIDSPKGTKAELRTQLLEHLDDPKITDDTNSELREIFFPEE